MESFTSAALRSHRFFTRRQAAQTTEFKAAFAKLIGSDQSGVENATTTIRKINTCRKASEWIAVSDPAQWCGLLSGIPARQHGPYGTAQRGLRSWPDGQ